MNSIGIALTVFGGIFLIMSIILLFVRYDKVKNTNCKDEAESVRTTIRNSNIFLSISICMVVAGVLLILMS